MNIVCEKCNTVYRFDASRIPPGGKKVKCSNCLHVFLAMPVPDNPGNAANPDPAQEASSATDADAAKADARAKKVRSEDMSESRRRLLLRQDATRYAVKDLATLQRWIVERRVGREAEMSEDGGIIWQKISERMDLLPFFAIVDQSRKKGAGKRKPDPLIQANAQRDAAAPDDAVETTDATGEADEHAPSHDLSLSEVSIPSADAISPTRSDSIPELSVTATGTFKLPLEFAESVGSVRLAGAPKPEAAYEPPSQSRLTVLYPVGIVAVLITVFYVWYLRPGQQVPLVTKPTPVVVAVSPSPATPAPIPSEPSPSTVPAPLVPPEIPSLSSPTPITVPPTRPAEALNSATKPEPVPKPRAKNTSDSVAATPGANPGVQKLTEAPTEPSLSPVAEPTGPRAVVTATAAAAAKANARQGQILMKQERYEDAVAEFRKASTKNPNSAEIHKDLGEALLSLSEVKHAQRKEYLTEAVAALQKAVKMRKKYAEAYHLLGVAQMYLEQNSDAAASFRAALASGLKGDFASETRKFLQDVSADEPNAN